MKIQINKAFHKNRHVLYSLYGKDGSLSYRVQSKLVWDMHDVHKNISSLDICNPTGYDIVYDKIL
jgi:hypothetical protein